MSNAPISTSAALHVVDSGLRAARANLAMTASLAELRCTGAVHDLLRFQHFPPSAIIGRHQSLTDEVRLHRCREKSVETARRMTGGGAIYMGPGLLGWELILARGQGTAVLAGSLASVAETLCMGLARGLSQLGVDARFRPRNDIEVGGRKVSGTGGYWDGDVLVFQGTVLIDFDVADMADVLVLPVAKLDRKGLASLAARVVSLRELLGHVPAMQAVQSAVTDGLASALGATWRAGVLTAEAEARAATLLAEEFGRDDFVAGDEGWRGSAAVGKVRGVASDVQLPGGRLSAHARVRVGPEALIERIWLVGDILVTPPRALLDLEAALVGCPLGDAPRVAREFLASRAVEVLGADASELVQLIARLDESASRAGNDMLAVAGGTA